MILVANPARQHADQLAAGLVEAGEDTLFLHGSAIRDSLESILDGHERQWALGRIVARATEMVLPAAAAESIAFECFKAFDRAVARRIRRSGARAVVSYEMSALDSFRAAQDRGIPKILDAADVHFRTQAEADSPFRRRVNARKTAELALADHVLTCSELARQSYVDAGIPADRVHALTLGVDLGAFSVADGPPDPGPLRLAFAGRFTRKKGADILADALVALREAGLPYACRIAANIPTAEPGYVEQLKPVAELLGKQPPGALPALYHWADALVVPSRFDSFGLVVLEAMACGLPVIASDMVGAKDYITHRVDGAIFPLAQPERLADLLKTYARDPETLRAMRPAAAARAQRASWSHYRAAVARKIAELIG